MKKTYITPSTITIKVELTKMIAGSEVIPYGGQTEQNLSRQNKVSWDDEEEIGRNGKNDIEDEDEDF